MSLAVFRDVAGIVLAYGLAYSIAGAVVLGGILVIGVGKLVERFT